MKELLTNNHFLIIVGLGIIILFIAVFIGGFTINTKWGSIFKNDTNEKINQKITKIKAQINYNKDMKTSVLFAIGQLYGQILREYIIEKNLIVEDKIVLSNIKYYRLIVKAINDECESITIDRYILDNNLYRFKNENDWQDFVDNIVQLYLDTGKQVLIDNYDNNLVVMPLHEWVVRAGKGLNEILTEHTQKLLKNLKMESIICEEKNDI